MEAEEGVRVQGCQERPVRGDTGGGGTRGDLFRMHYAQYNLLTQIIHM